MIAFYLDQTSPLRLTFHKKAIARHIKRMLSRFMLKHRGGLTIARVRGIMLGRARFFCLILGCIVSLKATTVVPPEFPTLVNESDYIVHAVTKSVHAEKRTGPNGTKIFTRVELEVIEIVAGTPPEKIVLELLGGRVGDEVMIIEGMPRFRVGDEDILFVSGNGRTICPLYGMMHGRYSVQKDSANGRAYVARSDGEPLRTTAQISTPVAEISARSEPSRAAAVAVAIGPTEFIRQIKAAIKPDARLNRAK